MQIIPALDLYKGNVVRFVRGEPSSSTIYSRNPPDTAKKWENEGAAYLHLVDLSAALDEGDNIVIIKEILSETKMAVEVGGGIRSIEKAEILISSGAQRVIIGTKGLDESFLDSLIDSVGKEKVAVSVDVIDSYLAVEGWQKKTQHRGLDFIAQLSKKGINWVMYTDISRDGTLQGVNPEGIRELSQFPGMNFIIAGGVSSLDDINKIKQECPFVWGVILGRALYENKVNLKEALSLVQH